MKSNCNRNRSNCQIIFCPILSIEFRSNLMVNLGVLVFVISKTKTPLNFRHYEKLRPPTKPMCKICMESNYDRSKTVIRKTNENYHLRADDPLLLKIWRHQYWGFKKRMKSHRLPTLVYNCTLKICLTPPIVLTIILVVYP